MICVGFPFSNFSVYTSYIRIMCFYIFELSFGSAKGFLDYKRCSLGLLVGLDLMKGLFVTLV